ncbi:MAG: LysR family transcriptional regulator [Sphingomonadales bacterium RIFCSPHIGHO2_01_FULL_65_20]|jgi:LysR family glycine cleavage system transcriptional activator|uniref:LysR family transcriptional regulator n=1 Tax=Blastomonas TaxID=150203 RepID=UPI0008318753|nr:LysR family transcriptional regulator [Sphingomonas ursincola]MBA4780541.1 LysR family transcriptional regulator [Blastomonas sp.]MBY0619712.1 LysR family transcriptional regulator [Sphingomonas ursincola]MCH2237768.1 LysR family transcriptional regulator [Blastomonas sp.]OHC97190.1 MAG: LysR family transcriptional regulator [Sphingomonadales bacterium RIFCSPHIGHO2_01_FULL_65_20]
MKRTHLPLNGLRVLDAAARHLSFTRAADELAVTPAAVGQQIRALEEMLGVVLFRRTPKGLELTDEAGAGLDALRSGFLQFEEAVRAMQQGQSSFRLTIAVPRDFAAKWLHHRLIGYAAANPEIRYTLVSGDSDIDFTEANLDCAIRLADGPAELEGAQIGPAQFVTVAAPGYDGNRRIDWPGCQRGTGEDEADDSTVMQVADAGLGLDAAIAGFGIVTVPWLLAERDLTEGRLVALGETRESRRAFWVVAPTPQWRQKKVKALVAALTAA